MPDFTLTGQIWGMPVNLTGQIAVNLMQPSYSTVMIESIVTIILSSLIGVILAIFVYTDFRPKLLLRIIPHWEDEKRGLVKIRMEIESCSKIVIDITNIQLQITEHDMLNGCLSEWVPFHDKSTNNTSELDEFNRKHLESEPVRKLLNPFPVFETTKKISPGEIVSGERLHSCPPNSILHIGLQVQAKLGILARLSKNFFNPREQWTSTVIITNKNWNGNIVQTSRPSKKVQVKSWWQFWL